MAFHAGRAGDLYEPRSDAEWDQFEAFYCYQCRLQGDVGRMCDIWLRAIWSEPGEDDYPTEWRYQADGQPTCTAFISDDAEDPA